MLPRSHVQKTVGTSRCRAPYWLEWRSRPPGGSSTFYLSCASCTVKCHHYEWRFTFNYCQLACRRCPVSSASAPGFRSDEQCFCQSCLSMVPQCIQVRKRPVQVVVKLADGKLHRGARREVSLPYTFDSFRSDDDFLVIEINY